VRAETDDILLAVEHVSLTFGGVKAISDVSFDIRKGEIRAIIGPNGAGKTSMLNVVNGFYRPQKGAIRWRGHARAHEAPRGRGARHRANVSKRCAVQRHDDAR
jgi:branched-chain amino acid transport system ATP-binding protein